MSHVLHLITHKKFTINKTITDKIKNATQPSEATQEKYNFKTNILKNFSDSDRTNNVVDLFVKVESTFDERRQKAPTCDVFADFASNGKNDGNDVDQNVENIILRFQRI
jgi:hypothetical protein